MSPATIQRLALVTGTLVACQAESLTAPFGLQVEERLELGSVAAAIRTEAVKHPVCPSVPAASGSGWTVRSLTRPAGWVFLPSLLRDVAGPTGQAAFFAPDMSAGVFLEEAPSLASIHPPEDSPLSQSAMATCQLRIEEFVSLVFLISQPLPARAGDSVHLAFVQAAGPNDHATRAGAFALTRALRDSLAGALLAFRPDPR